MKIPDSCRYWVVDENVARRPVSRAPNDEIVTEDGINHAIIEGRRWVVAGMGAVRRPASGATNRAGDRGHRGGGRRPPGLLPCLWQLSAISRSTARVRGHKPDLDPGFVWVCESRRSPFQTEEL